MWISDGLESLVRSRRSGEEATAEVVVMWPAGAVRSTVGSWIGSEVVDDITGAWSYQTCFDRKDEVVLEDGLTLALLSRCKPKRDEI